MAIVIDEVVAQVEPEPTPVREQPAAPARDRGVEMVRAQIALLARRAARLQAD
ncbi:MAG TPA: hypothetical protein VK636_23575 [Gemmatimonadaceae bacterium]|nr:hypothetical protein [Gemmatimonadaceae bacterium]